MVLHHISDSALLVIVFRACPNTETLRDNDLHMVNIFLVPERLEDTIGKTKCEDVLYCLFTHVMIDTIDLILTKYAREIAVQLLGRGQIVSKRLFDNDA